MDGFIVIMIISNLVSACYCSHLARHKGLSEGLWALGGLCFGVIALLAVIGMPINFAGTKETHGGGK